MSTNNKWEALSMRDRAFLIREAVRNGITDIGSIRDTWEHRFDGNSSQPTEDEYIAYKADSVKQAALNKARNRTKLTAPILGWKTVTKEELEFSQDELANINTEISEAQSRLEKNPNDYSAKNSLEYYRSIQKEAEKRYKQDSVAYATNTKIPRLGANCIYTVSGDYGRPVAGNETFRAMCQNLGFAKIPFEQTQPGDLVQFEGGGGVPRHALMANTHYNKDTKQMRYNGSSGGTSENSIRINRRYKVTDLDAVQSYRFVGNHADSLKWKNEYKAKYPPKPVSDSVSSNPVFDSIPGMLNTPIHNLGTNKLSITASDIREYSGHKFSGEDDVNPIIDFSKKAVEKAKNTWGNLKKFVTEAFTPDDSDRTFHTIKESDVTRGAGYLYDPDFYKYNTVFKDSTNNKLYFYPDDISNIDILEIPRAYEPISKDEVRKLLPKRDYVGGRNNLETRNKAATLIPGLLDSIQAISGRHKIPAGLMHHRIGKEGYYDANAWEYNYGLYTDEMPGYWENIANKEVDGFGLLGLDDAGTLLQNGDIKLTKHVSWKPKVHRNEKNREVISVWTPTLWDALEIKAGDIKYRQEEMKKRGYRGKDLETWTNAAYNLGMYHKDLEKKEWIRKNYTVPDYSNLFKK